MGNGYLWSGLTDLSGTMSLQPEELAGLTVRNHPEFDDEDDWDEDGEEGWDEGDEDDWDEEDEEDDWDDEDEEDRDA